MKILMSILFIIPEAGKSQTYTLLISLCRIFVQITAHAACEFKFLESLFHHHLPYCSQIIQTFLEST